VSVAIVGLACRYPDATTPAQLWQNVLGRRRAFRRIPGCRLSDGYFGGRDQVDATYVGQAAVLRDWEFDRERFGIPGRLYRSADRTHWLALETAAEALSDAGFADGDGLDRDCAGVVMGNSLTGEFSRAGTLRLRWPFLADAAATALTASDVPPEQAAGILKALEGLVKRQFPEPGDELLTGSLSNTIAGRICNQFDFHGTGYTVDGACASSLLAVMTAARALEAGELDFALAGGVDMSLDPMELIGFARVGALADGGMRVYDERPTGFLPGEGCGVVALMRTADAERLGLRVYARVAGWGSSSDGAGGLSRPETDGQRLALARAYRSAAVAPDRIGLVEGHGTGTAVGDRVELSALSAEFGPAGRAPALGTVKANIGHTKAAAGVAGMIKAALAVFHRVLPPSTGTERPHELLRGPDAAVRLLDEPEPWTDRVPRAGVSSMGFGGINAHVVLEGAPGRAPALPASTRRWATRAPGPEIVVLGAATREELAGRLREFAGYARDWSAAELGDIAATAWQDLGTPRFRAALLAETPERLAAAAAAAAERTAGFHADEHLGYAIGGAPRIGLLFPGQAAPVRPDLPAWAGPLAVPPLPGALANRESTVDTDVAQPSIVRQSLAGLAWLRTLGVDAVAAAGHSLGELTALHWAGVCAAEAVVGLAATRGRLMAEHAVAGGEMAALRVAESELPALLEGTDVAVAGYNAPRTQVVSGSGAGIRTVVDRARRAGRDATALPVSHAFHSPAMKPAAGPLRDALAGFEFCAAEAPVISTITGREWRGDADALRAALVDQLTAPVRFTDAVAELARRCDLLVETGPGTVLGSHVTGIPVVSTDTGGDPRRHAFATATLAAAAEADLEPWFAGRAFRPLRWDTPPSFVANPCEDRAGWAAADALPTAAPATVAVAEPAATTASDDPLTALVAHLSDTLELPAEAIAPDQALLRDLHLNSLQVVQQVSAVADGLGRRPPDTPLSLASATVADAADAIAEMPPVEDREPPAAGVADWVRAFAVRWEPYEPAGSHPVRWTVRAPAGHWLHEAGDGPADHLAIALDPGEDVAELLAGLAEATPKRLLIVHTGHPAAAAIARSAAAELAGCAVTVADLPDGTRVDPALLTPDASGYLELRGGPGGRGLERATVVAHRHAAGAPPALTSGDVCVVTGGVAGITAVAATALAERTGCTLVFAGRSAADAPAVAEHLPALRDRVAAHYVRCDVTDESDVRRLVAAAGAHGPVRGLLHGAGVNEPHTLGDLTAASLEATVRPKVLGLRALLAAAGPDLTLVAGFGSIIGRQGLAGQAAYCVANDMLRIELEHWAAAHPRCRTHVLEWSVWSGAGMGVRLDVLDRLRAGGVEPITPDRGVRALLDVLDDPGAPVTLTLAARFPQTPTLSLAPPPEVSPRFAERVLAHTAGVEAVVEASLDPGADPYLDDHRIDGTAVLPAVLGMEAMAQAAQLVTGAGHRALTGIGFTAPVSVDEDGQRTVRTAALAGSGAESAVRTVVRDDVDRFAADRFTATVRPAGPAPARLPPAEPLTGTSPWYGSLFFHDGRFRRVAGYRALSAFTVDAWLAAPEERPRWFSEFHSGQLVLGDPGAHDAALHALLACVPHRRALPVGADGFTVWRRPAGPLRVLATERSHTADDYVFDVTLAEPGGEVVARWDGLALHAIGRLTWPDGMPAPLLGPWLSRRLVECGIDDRCELVAGTGELVAPGSAGSAWEPVGGEEPDPLDAVACELLADKTGDDRATVVARARAGRRAAGLQAGPGASLDTIDQVTEDGIVVARSGPLRVLTARVDVLGTGRPVVLAVADRTDS
jgi:enediyne polyketide synthase